MATAPFTCFAIAAPGLEPLVARELASLGERPRPEDGGVTWEGDARSMMRANLWLRTASRVLVRVARFPATAFFELERSAKRIPWGQFVASGARAEFRVTARKSKLFHTGAIAERLLSAIGPRLTTSRSPNAASQLFVVRVMRDVFEISADTSGELLHMRGYRQAVGKAPLRETLAAALLLASEWGGDRPLIDPLCGSGTIPIEGALIARQLAPGLRRQFAFQQWPDFDGSVWSELVREARSRALANLPVVIAGSDRDAGVTAAARANAERAGVTDIRWSTSSLSEMHLTDEPGLVATNPPYGKRVGRGDTVRNLYAQLGNVLRQKSHGWELALYAADPRLAAQIGLSLRELFRSSNGGIKVAALAGKVP